jgi:hypothetical protein
VNKKKAGSFCEFFVRFFLSSFFVFVFVEFWCVHSLSLSVAIETKHRKQQTQTSIIFVVNSKVALFITFFISSFHIVTYFYFSI